MFTSRFVRSCCLLAIAAGAISVQTLPGSAQSLERATQMAKDATPQFEIAVIRPTDPSDDNQGFHMNGHQLFIENESLSSLISFAYSLHPSQIGDAPAWVAHDRFDITGVPDIAGSPDLKQYQMMVQKLLKDRFHFRFRREERRLPVYSITVARSGAKIVKSAGDPNGVPDQTGYGKGNTQVMKFTNNSMSDLALGMQSFLDKPVIDNTGLKGRYDFTLTWTPELTAESDSASAPGVFTAFQDQLGLKLQPTKEPIEALVVEHLERPSEN